MTLSLEALYQKSNLFPSNWKVVSVSKDER